MSFKEDLARFGITPHDTVLIHSSLRAIAPGPGRADQMLDEMEDYLSDGLLALPSLTYHLFALPAGERVFDVENTACAPGIGTLPELFRKRPEVVRAVHASHAIAAAGKYAAAFVAGQEDTHTPCAEASAWGRLRDTGGWILLAGCDLRNCTFFHGVEEWTVEGLHLGEEHEFTLRFTDGSTRRTMSRPHAGSPSEQFDRAEEALIASGALTFGTFGSARTYALRAHKAWQTVRDLILRDVTIFDDPGMK